MYGAKEEDRSTETYETRTYPRAKMKFNGLNIKPKKQSFFQKP